MLNITHRSQPSPGCGPNSTRTSRLSNGPTTCLGLAPWPLPCGRWISARSFSSCLTPTRGTSITTVATTISANQLTPSDSPVTLLVASAKRSIPKRLYRSTSKGLYLQSPMYAGQQSPRAVALSAPRRCARGGSSAGTLAVSFMPRFAMDRGPLWVAVLPFSSVPGEWVGGYSW
jgi:hypothetical protein